MALLEKKSMNPKLRHWSGMWVDTGAPSMDCLSSCSFSSAFPFESLVPSNPGAVSSSA